MRRYYPLLALLPVLVIGGCETIAVGVATPIAVQKRHVNVVNASYAAVDTLTQQTSQRLDRNRPMVIHRFNEIVPTPDPTHPMPKKEKALENPNLGDSLRSQMTTRLVQLGYNVVLDEPSLEAAGKNAVDFYGTYEIYGLNFLGSGGTLKVVLKLVDRGTGRVMGIHDYSIPVTDEVRAYMADGNTVVPKVFRD